MLNGTFFTETFKLDVCLTFNFWEHWKVFAGWYSGMFSLHSHYQEKTFIKHDSVLNIQRTFWNNVFII